jgi:hypothetical protein
MERVTAELRDSLIAGFSREALHLEMRDLYAAADHGRFRKWLAGGAGLLRHGLPGTLGEPDQLLRLSHSGMRTRR